MISRWRAAGTKRSDSNEQQHLDSIRSPEEMKISVESVCLGLAVTILFHFSLTGATIITVAATVLAKDGSLETR